MDLRPHPRLYAGPEELKRLKKAPRPSLLKQAAEEIKARAEEYRTSPVFDYPRNTHNAHLIRARRMQTRVLILLARWVQTGDEEFREATLAHVREMGAWEYWSWITWRQGDPSPEAIYDLSYGENSATLAVAYDWLYDTFSEEERQLFVDIARGRSLKPFLAHTGKNPASWFRRPDSNWNTVCAGGAGMLALAMYEELSEARKSLPRVERSFEPYMRHLQETRGAWPEGIGYWNYGMRYAFTYLLSCERAIGKKHPLMQLSSTKATLRFPLDFCPNAVPCSFGDVNHWKPLPFHYAAAVRLGCADLVPVLDQHLEKQGIGSSWPDAAELLLFHPRTAGKRRPSEKNVVRIYKGMDWGVLADRMPAPHLYLAVRGGTTEVPHGHRDLLSFHCVVGEEALINTGGVGEYLDTTFSNRRYELFETVPASKNAILINGVGITGGASVKTRALKYGAHRGILMDATQAMGEMRDGSAARFCGRLFLLLRNRAFLIVDRVELAHFGRVEARFHTYGGVKAQRRGAQIRGQKERLSLSWAADVPASLFQAVGAPTTPGRAANILRWCTEGLHHEVTFATLISPEKGKVSLEAEGARLAVSCEGRVWKGKVVLTKRLRPAR